MKKKISWRNRLLKGKYIILMNFLGCLLLAAAPSSYNQTQINPPDTKTTSAFCSSPEYKQFDFWVGNWDAYDGKGVLQGHNLVEKIQGGCALQEYWKGTEGGTGTSFSIYDSTRKVWNQTFISSHGTLLPIEGYLQGNSIVLIGMHIGADGRSELHRTSWTPTDDGVHHVWDFSKDGGRTWEIKFEGFLRKAKKPYPGD